MITVEKFKFALEDRFLRNNFGGDPLPEPILIELDRLQKMLDSEALEPAEYLSPIELSILHDFAFQKRKIEWLGGRLAAKHAALQVTGEEPTAKAMRRLTITADQYGRPYLEGCPAEPPELSISHSQGIASAVASAKKKCGLDLQKISEATLRVQEKFCSPAEEEIIASLGPSEPSSGGMTLLWAAKEALRKARGGHPLTGFNDMRLKKVVRAGIGNLWLFELRVKDDSYRIPTTFHKDYAVSLCLI